MTSMTPLTKGEIDTILQKYSLANARVYDPGVLNTEPAWSSFEVEETAKGPRHHIKIYFSAGSSNSAQEALDLFDKLQSELDRRRESRLE